MDKKRFTIIMVIITAAALVSAFGLTRVSASIAKAREANAVKEEIIGTWTDSANPQMVIQFTKDDVVKMMGSDVATFTLDSQAATLTMNYSADFGSKTVVYNYAISEDQKQLTMTDTATGVATVYVR